MKTGSLGVATRFIMGLHELVVWVEELFLLIQIRDTASNRWVTWPGNRGIHSGRQCIVSIHCPDVQVRTIPSQDSNLLVLFQAP